MEEWYPRALFAPIQPGHLPASFFRFVRISLPILLLALTAFLHGCSSTGPTGSPPPDTDLENACQILRDHPSWYTATARTEQKWGIPIQIQLAIIYHESTFRQDARPGSRTNSSAYGYAQVKDATWQWYQDKTGNHSGTRTNFFDATDFIGWYCSVSQKHHGISKWDSYNQYLAYHEGHGGWKRKSYLQKGWLIKVAKKVEARASRYGGQLRACRSGLIKGSDPDAAHF